MEPELEELVGRAQAGDVRAYGRVVELTQAMVYAAVRRVVRDPEAARDVTQEVYLRAFRGLRSLREPRAFLSWLRRVALTTARGQRRTRRVTVSFVAEPPEPRESESAAFGEPPVLDEGEVRWSEGQRSALAAALLRLTKAERVLCDRHYHGGWPLARLAAEAGVGEAAMRKRMQRVRERLRKEIEMSERKRVVGEPLPEGLPAKVVELLARPRLTELPENPVGRAWDLIRPFFAECEELELEEVIGEAEVRAVLTMEGAEPGAAEAYLGMSHRVDAGRVLRADLEVPTLVALRGVGRPVRVVSHGKSYRAQEPNQRRMEAFHQAEYILTGEGLDEWGHAGFIARIVEHLFPGRPYQVLQSQGLPLHQRVWEVELQSPGGDWWEVLSWGQYSDAGVRWLGLDPTRYGAVGGGFGLERIGALVYDIDDIRKLEAVRIER